MSNFEEEAAALAIALLTASQASDYEQMAEVMNDITMGNISAVIASLAGLAAAFLEHCAVELNITPLVLLHTLGVANAAWPE